MKTYWELGENNERAAKTLNEVAEYNACAYHLQQAAELYAKALLEYINPKHERLRSHAVHNILLACDDSLSGTTVLKEAKALTALYYDTRYPGDNYWDVDKTDVADYRSGVAMIKRYCFEAIETIKEKNTDTVIKVDELKKIE